jgi:hypothetical protein
MRHLWIIILLFATSAKADDFEVVFRGSHQDQNAWIIDYRLKYQGSGELWLNPQDVTAKIDGWVSNSRLEFHNVPRKATTTIENKESLTGSSAPIFTKINEDGSKTDEKCEEQVSISIWIKNGILPPNVFTATTNPPLVQYPVFDRPICIIRNDIINIRIKLEHYHIIYGDYDVLLGVRDISLDMGFYHIKDIFHLDKEEYVAYPQFEPHKIPEERLDNRYSMSGQSLHLTADVPGNQYYRYPEQPVRYSSKMRLSFWYLIANGTEGECKFRVAQYKETPIAWKPLYNEADEQRLRVVGQWTKFERIINTTAETTKVTVEFKINSECDIGKMWIDNFVLEHVNQVKQGP